MDTYVYGQYTVVNENIAPTQQNERRAATVRNTHKHSLNELVQSKTGERIQLNAKFKQSVDVFRRVKTTNPRCLDLAELF